MQGLFLSSLCIRVTVARDEDIHSCSEALIGHRFALFCVVQVGGALGWSRIIHFLYEFPNCRSSLQGDFPPRSACNLEVSHSALSRLLSCPDIHPSVHAHPLSTSFELLLGFLSHCHCHAGF